VTPYILSSTVSAAKVPCGRSGPEQAAAPAPVAAPDAINLLLTTVVPMVTIMAQQMMAFSKKRSRHYYSPLSSLPSSIPSHLSLPPPVIDNELNFFM